MALTTQATLNAGSNVSQGVISIFYGTATTRAGVLADVDTAVGRFPCPTGSLYISSAGKMYRKQTQSSPPVNTDWELISYTASD